MERYLKRAGKAVRWKWRFVRRQEGVCGWRRAQERCVIKGCAGEVMGVMVGRKGVEEGWRMGDVKGLGMLACGAGGGRVTYGQCSLEIEARLSTISFEDGHGRWEG